MILGYGKKWVNLENDMYGKPLKMIRKSVVNSLHFQWISFKILYLHRF